MRRCTNCDVKCIIAPLTDAKEPHEYVDSVVGIVMVIDGVWVVPCDVDDIHLRCRLKSLKGLKRLVSRARCEIVGRYFVKKFFHFGVVFVFCEFLNLFVGWH